MQEKISNSYTKYITPPLVNSKFLTKIAETKVIDIASQLPL